MDIPLFSTNSVMTKKTKKSISSLKGGIIIYRASDGKTALDVRLEGETLWLNQKQLSELFQTERSVITKHFGNIFRSGELDKNSVCAKFAHTAEDGKTYQTNFYNLDAVISVGYRVNSKRGQFNRESDQQKQLIVDKANANSGFKVEYRNSRIGSPFNGRPHLQGFFNVRCSSF